MSGEGRFPVSGRQRVGAKSGALPLRLNRDGSKQVFPKVAAGFGSKNLLDKGS